MLVNRPTKPSAVKDLNRTERLHPRQFLGVCGGQQLHPADEGKLVNPLFRLDTALKSGAGPVVPTSLHAGYGGRAWNNGKEVPRWGVAEIQKMSPSTTGRCYCCH